MSTEANQAPNPSRKADETRQPVINVHMHLINFALVPNNYYQTFFRPLDLDEEAITSGWFRFLVRVICLWRKLVGGRGRRLNDLLDLFTSYVNELTDYYVIQMLDNRIKLAAPLMMDLGPANPSLPPEVPFEFQVGIMHEQMIRHPGRFLPFVMFDPRRPGGLSLCRRAIEDLGFGGIKLYPPLGYHPVWDNPVNDTAVGRNLYELYDWCQAERIPITVHCSQGGAVAEAVSHGPALQTYLCRPRNWRPVLDRFPQLILNLAHFGGHWPEADLLPVADTEPEAADCAFSRSGQSPGLGPYRWRMDHVLGEPRLIDTDLSRKRGRAARTIRWRNDIICLMRDFEHVYADVAYHSQALAGPGRKLYFEQLGRMLTDPVLGGRILFGTDWLMTAHTWTEFDYVRAFRHGLDTENFQRLTWDNPRRFLDTPRRGPMAQKTPEQSRVKQDA